WSESVTPPSLLLRHFSFHSVSYTAATASILRPSSPSPNFCSSISYAAAYHQVRRHTTDMTTVGNQARLIARDENLEVRQKKAAFDGKTKNLKGAGKNGKEGISTRRPLGDLTNKKNIHVDMTAKKPTAPQNEFHKSEECFLHDHSKCIGAKNADLKSSVLDLILPKYTVFTDKHVCLQEKEDRDSSLNPDKMEIPDMLQWDSPTPLHKRTDSPPSTFAWQFEPVEFALKDEKTKNIKRAAKKGSEGITARKPLGDLTNKKDIHVEVTTKKLPAPQNEFNIAEECFLHDHSKCIDANNAALKLSLLDLILPKCGKLAEFCFSSISQYRVFTNCQDSVRQVEDLVSSLDPVEFEIPDLSQWDSPPPLYKHSGSPPSSFFSWQFEPVEFALQDDN
ncbi:hypothetical protein V2J09_012852, partial [Rumex salicifolius]